MATQGSVNDLPGSPAAVVAKEEWFAGGPTPRLQLPQGQPFAGRHVRYGTLGWYRRVDYVSLLVVTAGRGVLGRSDERDGHPILHALSPGRVFLLRPRDITFLRGRDPETVDIAFVGFPTAAWHSFALLAELDPRWETSPEPPHSPDAGNDPAVIAAFETAIARFDAGRATSLDLLAFWMAVAPKVLRVSDRQEHATTGIPAWLVDGLEAMQDEENLRGGLARLLELTHVSASHLAACTRRFYGHTPTEFVTELRLQRGAELLRLTDLGVGEIAQRCGFSSLVYFSRRFRTAHGMSPRDYRHSIPRIDDFAGAAPEDHMIRFARTS